MTSDKPPLVLLHPILSWEGFGMTSSGISPAITRGTHTPCWDTRGGPPVQRHPATITDVIDAAEKYLDDHRLERPHLVGNSTGGFVAIELSRRGRAATVCALSPAGFWSTEDGSKDRASNRARRVAAMCRLTRPVAPVIMKSPIVRRLALRSINVAWRADRTAAATVLGPAPATVRGPSAAGAGTVGPPPP
jgi:pimeloyl-ACP methyl ester carboxylesterase